MQQKRLYFIDIIRALAILMMLQGHFVETLLEPNYQNSDFILYQVWYYLRGITAPIFFTISGLVFSYLLLKAKVENTLRLRIKKGLQRGVMLIGIGYLLRIPIFNWFIGVFDTYFLIVDVLQCIGISIILILIVYLLTLKNTLFFSILMLLTSLLVFSFEPLYQTLELRQVPIVFANYLTTSNGSLFTLLPWFGYMAFGSFIATFFHLYGMKPNFKVKMILLLISIGAVFIFFSNKIVLYLGASLRISALVDASNYNYLFPRLGQVMLLFAVVYGLEKYLKHSIILKIGQKTLSIYIIHFIILYGSFTGFGLSQLIGSKLSIWQTIVGVILFLVLVCTIALNYAKTNAFLYKKLNSLIAH